MHMAEYCSKLFKMLRTINLNKLVNKAMLKKCRLCESFKTCFCRDTGVKRRQLNLARAELLEQELDELINIARLNIFSFPK